MKDLLNSLLMHYFNWRNGNQVSTKSYCSFRVSRNNSHIAVMAGCVIDPRVRIGEYTYVGYGCHISGDVGRYCSIGNNVSIAPGHHPLDGLSTSSWLLSQEVDLRRRGISVGHDVWIGSGAVLLSGITVGTGAVIGANSVVTKNVNDHEVVAGVPAKHIRNRMSAQESKIVLEKKWWLKEPHEVLGQVQSELERPDNK